MIAQRQLQPRIRQLTLALPLLGVAGAAGALAVLFWFDPTQYRFYPVCIFHSLTGLQCPGCGSLRALHALSHGHLLTALHYNPLLVLALPFLVFVGGRMLLREVAGKPVPPIQIRAGWIWLIPVTIILFTILRNIPVAPFTYLAPP